MKLSQRGNIPPFLILEAFQQAKALERQGRDMIHLTLGQPGIEAPRAVREHTAKLMLDAPLGYTEAPGYYPLRERIARHYAEKYGLSIPVERIFVTVGSSSAFFMSCLAAFDPGDSVALASPCYPAYPNLLATLGLECIRLPSTLADKYQPTVAMLQALPKQPDGLIIASPSNPTGTVLEEARLAELVAYCTQHGIRILSDEIYHGITYTDARCSSLLEHGDDGIVLNSFSKYYLLPGWRLGWCVVPEDMAPRLLALVQNFVISPPAISQYAALECFEHLEVLDGVVDDYRRNRDLLLAALPGMGFTDIAPAEGAFYIYAGVSGLTNDSADFCRRMMEETGVVIVPGTDFDPENGHRTVRISFSTAQAQIEDAIGRMKAWLK